MFFLLMLLFLDTHWFSFWHTNCVFTFALSVVLYGLTVMQEVTTRRRFSPFTLLAQTMVMMVIEEEEEENAFISSTASSRTTSAPLLSHHLSHCLIWSHKQRINNLFEQWTHTQTHFHFGGDRVCTQRLLIGITAKQSKAQSCQLSFGEEIPTVYSHVSIISIIAVIIIIIIIVIVVITSSTAAAHDSVTFNYFFICSNHNHLQIIFSKFVNASVVLYFVLPSNTVRLENSLWTENRTAKRSNSCECFQW